MGEMQVLPIYLVAMLAACGGTAGGPQRRPLGVSDHLVEAQRHDSEAEVHDALAEEASAQSRTQTQNVCGDRVLADQASSGGERLGVAPCWSASASAVERHHADATRLRAEATAHRHRAAELLAAEQASCVGLSAHDLDHTPFAHREDVAAVTAELEGGQLRGARIRFRALDGLDAAWLEQAIGCHRARAAAVGWDATYMTYDPSALANVLVTVTDDPDGVVVVVRTDDAQAAEIAYRRAEDLVDPAAVEVPQAP